MPCVFPLCVAYVPLVSPSLPRNSARSLRSFVTTLLYPLLLSSDVTSLVASPSSLSSSASQILYYAGFSFAFPRTRCKSVQFSFFFLRLATLVTSQSPCRLVFPTSRCRFVCCASLACLSYFSLRTLYIWYIPTVHFHSAKPASSRAFPPLKLLEKYPACISVSFSSFSVIHHLPVNVKLPEFPSRTHFTSAISCTFIDPSVPCLISPTARDRLHRSTSTSTLLFYRQLYCQLLETVLEFWVWWREVFKRTVISFQFIKRALCISI